MQTTIELGRGGLVTNKENTITTGVFSRLKLNLQKNKDAPLRTETLDGKTYQVVPMIMLTEGVHAGSAGPLFYPSEELSKTPEVWNHKPVVVYHPAGSACTPEVLEGRGIGLIMHTAWKGPTSAEIKAARIAKQDPPVGKLHAEAWIDVDKAKKVDKRVLNAIENGEQMELSTGLFTDNYLVESTTWRGEAYQIVARNYRPDHLAVLPDQVGACSMADGAGFLRLNQVSFEATRQLLHAALREKMGPDSYFYIEDVFPTWFAYCLKQEIYQQNYTATDTQANIHGEATKVVRVVQYRTEDGAIVGNVEIDNRINLNHIKECLMLRTALITAMIANGHWAEDDRKFLETVEEPRWKKITANAEALDKAKTEAVSNAAKAGAGQLVANSPIVPPVPAQQPAAPRQLSLKELIDAADPATRGMLANGLRAFEAQKTGLVSSIVATNRSPWKKEELDGMDIDTLQRIAQMAGVTANTQPIGHSYAGLADAFAPAHIFAPTGPSTNVLVGVEPMALPTMNFEKK